MEIWFINVWKLVGKIPRTISATFTLRFIGFSTNLEISLRLDFFHVHIESRYKYLHFTKFIKLKSFIILNTRKKSDTIKECWKIGLTSFSNFEFKRKLTLVFDGKMRASHTYTLVEISTYHSIYRYLKSEIAPIFILDHFRLHLNISTKFDFRLSWNRSSMKDGNFLPFVRGIV